MAADPLFEDAYSTVENSQESKEFKKQQRQALVEMEFAYIRLELLELKWDMRFDTVLNQIARVSHCFVKDPEVAHILSEELLEVANELRHTFPVLPVVNALRRFHCLCGQFVFKCI